MRCRQPLWQSLMRSPVPLTPVHPDRWEPFGAAGIEVLRLNEDPCTGARTALIRSVARPEVACRAQYHHCEEEFLCLGGLFTFDGVRWMRAWSYACYPPHVVHGAHVSVPGGYLLYLRTSGSTDVFTVAEPIINEAYHHPDCSEREPIVVLERTLAPSKPQSRDSPANMPVRHRVLRTQPEKHAAATLWAFDAGERDVFRHFPAATSLEVLIAPVDAESGCVHQPGSIAYGCYRPDDLRPHVDAEGPLLALVHSGPWA